MPHHYYPPVARPTSVEPASLSNSLQCCDLSTGISPDIATINRELANEGAALVLVMIAAAGRHS